MSLRSWTSLVAERIDGGSVKWRYAIRRRLCGKGWPISVQRSASLGGGYAHVTWTVSCSSDTQISCSFEGVEAVSVPKYERRSLILALFLPARPSGVAVVRHKTFRCVSCVVSRTFGPRHYTCVYARYGAAAVVRACTRVRGNAPYSTIDAAVAGKSSSVSLLALPPFIPRSKPRTRRTREGLHTRSGSNETWRARYFSARDRTRPIGAPRRAGTTVASPPFRSLTAEAGRRLKIVSFSFSSSSATRRNGPSSSARSAWLRLRLRLR